jgi:Fuc2NAc and GlcNAc transferase
MTSPTLMFTLLVIAAFASWITTGILRRYALGHALLDVPNARSSHSVPTPRGGGFAIAVVTLSGVVAAGVVGWIEPALTWALVGGGGLVAGVGWLDDVRTLPARVRALVHAAAAVWVVVLLGGMPVLDLGIATLELGALGALLAIVAIVWGINVYNFMDGIDGLAGSEAIVVALAAAALLVASGQPGLAFVAGLIAASAIGFIAWNWPPSSIFMGDVGSGLLGFLFGALAVACANAGAISLLSFALLLGVFIFDATITLLRRFSKGERWYAPHRLHAYQRATQAGWGHERVTGTINVINVVLALLAVAGWIWPQLLLLAFVVGSLGLAALYWWIERRIPMFGAGHGNQKRLGSVVHKAKRSSSRFIES